MKQPLTPVPAIIQRNITDNFPLILILDQKLKNVKKTNKTSDRV